MYWKTDYIGGPITINGKSYKSYQYSDIIDETNKVTNKKKLVFLYITSNSADEIIYEWSMIKFAEIEKTCQLLRETSINCVISESDKCVCMAKNNQEFLYDHTNSHTYNIDTQYDTTD